MRRYRLLIVLFFIASLVWAGLFILFHNELEQQVQIRSRAAAEEVAGHLSTRIEFRVKGIYAIAMLNSQNALIDKAAYQKNASVLTSQFEGFYAINWIDQSGVIRWVYPELPNQRALNKNLFERPELVPLLSESRKTGKTMISTRVLTYQGFYGVVVYVPIFVGDNFRGWANGLIDYTALLSKYFEQNRKQNYSVQLQWVGDSEPLYVHGDMKDGEVIVDKAFPIFNQNLNIRVTCNIEKELRTAKIYFFVLFVIGIVVFLLFILSLARLLFSEKRLLDANYQLVSKNTLVSALCHDLSNSVMILTNNLKRLQSGAGDKAIPAARLERAIQAQVDLLSAVRNLHVNSLTKEKHELLPVEAASAVKDAVELVNELAEKKNIKFIYDAVSGHVLADRTTLINCVLLNVLKNAVKFSPQGTSVQVKTIKSGNEVALAVVDQGVGIEAKRLQQLFTTLLSTSTVGTEAEVGTGLGLFQVKYFMEAYGGRVEVVSDSTQNAGTTVTLWFRLLN